MGWNDGMKFFYFFSERGLLANVFDHEDIEYRDP